MNSKLSDELSGGESAAFAGATPRDPSAIAAASWWRSPWTWVALGALGAFFVFGRRNAVDDNAGDGDSDLSPNPPSLV